jgi:hypothetical protein
MKFKVGFVLGAAAGAWIANRATELQRGPGAKPAVSPVEAADEAAERLRAITNLARERLTTVMDGPVGNLARDRIADLIGASLSQSRDGEPSGRHSSRNRGSIDTKASWRS